MAQKKLIIDTNLLLLLVIGAVEGGRHIKNSKRLNKFTLQDYQTVIDVMVNHQEVCITPYIAAEVSNLIDLRGYAARLAYETARILFAQFRQVHSDIATDSAQDTFLAYGLTDSSLVRLAADHTILTDDQRLFGALFSACAENILPFEVVRKVRN
ncbi:hypothetical protein BXU06_00860 [Aquaspirillum sp. LM1]|uniref:hypothetical protein n=1 Tax=Aquaspirillum sp. LM1 TaxID=1938604 RepID=UPI00098391EF|nr:hypothetical protein [Aquaspirillum sp. LM1]AQR63777.1 hypothetical protein BXU06_00860 [Aquaspirillum sp. LM1]